VLICRPIGRYAPASDGNSPGPLQQKMHLALPLTRGALLAAVGLVQNRPAVGVLLPVLDIVLGLAAEIAGRRALVIRRLVALVRQARFGAALAALYRASIVGSRTGRSGFHDNLPATAVPPRAWRVPHTGTKGGSAHAQ